MFDHISDLKVEESKKKKSAVYQLREKGATMPFYLGITEQAPRGQKSQAEVRFD